MGLFDDLYKLCFDIDGNGKIDAMDDMMYLWMLDNQKKATEKKNAKHNTFMPQYTPTPKNTPHQPASKPAVIPPNPQHYDDYSWRDSCEDGFDYGIDPDDYETEEEYEIALEDAKENEEIPPVIEIDPQVLTDIILQNLKITFTVEYNPEADDDPNEESNE